MASLKSVEMDVLQAVREVAGTYQNYEENFNDEKYAEIKEYFIQPLIGKTNSLMTAFEAIGTSVKKFSDEGMITES